MSDAGLDTLEGIRKEFARRFDANVLGYHALGEAVLQHYRLNPQGALPASAMTFRNFLRGKTSVRDPRALELYFQHLGATDAEMQAMRATFTGVQARRMAAPRRKAALRAVHGGAVMDMPYAHALAECEVVTRFEESISAPVAHVTPKEYMLGTGVDDDDDDPERWGLIQHLRELVQYFDGIEDTLAADMAAIPRRQVRQRRIQAAADLREAMSAYAAWLLARPRYAEFFFSRRRYMLHGPLQDEDRALAISLSKRASRFLHPILERLAVELFWEGDDRKGVAKSPASAVAIEEVAQRIAGIPHSFYVVVVLGGAGTGAAFQGAYQCRREESGSSISGGPVWTKEHERLIRSYDDAVARANAAIEENPMVAYGELKAIYDEHAEKTLPRVQGIWEADYAPSIAREAGMLLMTAMHARGSLSDREVASFTKFFLTSRAGREVQQAVRDDITDRPE